MASLGAGHNVGVSPRLAAFLPGSEAEPETRSGSNSALAPQEKEQGDSTTPSVLNKLQKWADYAAVGEPVWPTNFIPMKTPMSDEILDNWSLPEAPRHALTVPRLLASQAAVGRQIGLIIDLANHDCLYSDDVPDSVEYQHVQLVAKVLPSREAIDEVERIANSYWAEHPTRYIAIHCAYGFNRTGFVVCSYLCQACGLSVEQALESFAAARPPGVKHEKFIRELHARYGGGSAVTPEGSMLGGSPLAAAAVDELAAEAQRLRQASLRQQRAAGGAAAQPAARAGGAPCQAAAAAGAAGDGDGSQDEEGEPLHFEDAADAVRRDSRRRSLNLSRAGTAGSAEAVPLPIPPPSAGAARSVTPSRSGSAASSRNPSRHGGRGGLEGLAGSGSGGLGASAGASPLELRPAGEAAAAAAAAEGFAASRRLMQRSSSRGSRGGGISGGLAVALGSGGGGGGLARHSGGSSTGAAGGSPAGGSLSGGARTAQSSMSDFAAAAVHLEGGHLGREASGHSMRRSTSLGLAKALSEDFLQNNGTPSTAAPISLAAERDEALEGEEEEEQQQRRQGAPADREARPGSGGASPDPPAAAPRQHQAQLSSTDGTGGGGEEPPCHGQPQRASSPPLGSSPSKRGGIPPPPCSRASAGAALASLRAGASPLPPPQLLHHQWQASQAAAAAQAAQQGQQQQQGLPGTPITPSSSTGCFSGSLQKRSSAGPAGFQRSMSVDSENPSLGFNMREALAGLRGAADGGAHRGPQALADLFREDSCADVAALDVEDHLAALELGADLDSPAVPGRLHAVPAAAAAAAAVDAGSAPAACLQRPALPPAGVNGTCPRPPQPEGLLPPPKWQQQPQQQPQQQSQQQQARGSPGKSSNRQGDGKGCSVM